MIKEYGSQFPWSPKISQDILELSIKKLIKSELKTKTSRASKLQQLTSRLYKLDNNYPKQNLIYETKNMKLINNNKLKEIQKLSYYS